MASLSGIGVSLPKISLFDQDEPPDFVLDQSISPINYFNEEQESPFNIHKIIDMEK